MEILRRLLHIIKHSTVPYETVAKFAFRQLIKYLSVLFGMGIEIVVNFIMLRAFLATIYLSFMYSPSMQKLYKQNTTIKYVLFGNLFKNHCQIHDAEDDYVLSTFPLFVSQYFIACFS